MTNWIIPNSPRYYDVDKEFCNNQKIDWYQTPQMKNLKTGDTVYVYRSTPIMEIRWKCCVGETMFYLDEFDNHYDDSNNETYEGPFFELFQQQELLCGKYLSYSELTKHGLRSRLMGPQKVSGELLTYIEDTIEQFTSDSLFIESMSDNDIKEAAEKYSKLNINRKHISHTKAYQRNPYIAQYAKICANGKCQLCMNKAPFLDKKNKPYLESHHIVWLSKGGTDSIDNTVALCPNCHKKMHILNDLKDIEVLSRLVKK